MPALLWRADQRSSSHLIARAAGSMLPAAVALHMEHHAASRSHACRERLVASCRCKQKCAVQVGKAWLFLSQLYKTNPSPSSQQMAEAALVRSWEIYALCQVSASCEVRM